MESSYFHLNRIRNLVLNNFKLWLLCVTEYFIKFGMSPFASFVSHLALYYLFASTGQRKRGIWPDHPARPEGEKSALGNELHILSADRTMACRCNHNFRMKGLKGSSVRPGRTLRILYRAGGVGFFSFVAFGCRDIIEMKIPWRFRVQKKILISETVLWIGYFSVLLSS